MESTVFRKLTHKKTPPYRWVQRRFLSSKKEILTAVLCLRLLIRRK